MSVPLLTRRGRTEAEEAAAITAALVDPFPYDETIPGYVVNAVQALPGANNLILIEAPRRNSILTIGRFRHWIGTSSGNVDVGVWTFDGTTYTLVGSTGSTPAGTLNAVQTIVPGASIVVPKHVRRFYGIAADNTTVTFGRFSSLNALINVEDKRMRVRAASFPLATNAASFTDAGLTQTANSYWIRAAE